MSPDVPAGASPLLATAVEAVRQAGAIQLAHLQRGITITNKGEVDIVTDADIEVETMFRAMVAERFPGHRVLGEELEDAAGASSDGIHCWLFDPIDGTVNFAHGLPFFCASLALEIRGTVELAAVYEPVRSELFTAERGRGAWLNGVPLRVSSTAVFAKAVLGTGFPHNALSRVKAMEDLIGESAVRVRALRRLGSAALDLSYVAAGRVDAFWDRNLKPWDTAAGALLVTEAGGAVTNFDGGAFSCHRGGVLASNGALHAEMLALMRATGVTEG
jgi:myo-inositol-1(or 4)-monophosphatase